MNKNENSKSKLIEQLAARNKNYKLPETNFKNCNSITKKEKYDLLNSNVYKETKEKLAQKKSDVKYFLDKDNNELSLMFDSNTLNVVEVFADIAKFLDRLSKKYFIEFKGIDVNSLNGMYSLKFRYIKIVGEN